MPRNKKEMIEGPPVCKTLNNVLYLRHHLIDGVY